MMIYFFKKSRIAALTVAIIGLFAHANAEVADFNSIVEREFVGEKLEFDGLSYSISEATTITFDGSELKLGSEGIKIRVAASQLVFKNRSVLEASSSFSQYNEPTGSQNLYNTSYIVVDGVLFVKPNGNTITLHRVKSASENKSAALVVVGPGSLDYTPTTADKVKVYGENDIKGMIITIAAKGENG